MIFTLLAEVVLGIAWGISFPADIPGGYTIVVGVEDYPGHEIAKGTGDLD